MQPLVIPGFLEVATCEQVRAAMERGVSEPAEIIGERIVRATAVRRAESIEVDQPVLARLEEAIESARAAIEAHFHCSLGEREGTSLLRYGTGSFYRPHRDRGRLAGWPAAARRQIAVVLFLNEGFEGGELHLYGGGGEPVRFVPATGLLLAFPAAVLHEVLPVRSGVRNTAVDWFYDPEPGNEPDRDPSRITIPD